MSEGSSAKLRSIQAFRDFEQRGSPPEERSLSAEAGPGGADEVSALRVLAAVKRRAGGARRSELVHELQASPAAVETALLRLLKDGLVSVRAGSEPDEILVAS